MYGAAPMPPDSARALIETFPRVALFQLCGQTEPEDRRLPRLTAADESFPWPAS
jgi:hypothetical protein